LNGIYTGDLTTCLFDRILALEQLSRLPHAPSVGLHDVPSESVGTHIGLKDYDELDERLAREYSDARYISRYSVMKLTFPPLLQQNTLITSIGCKRQLEIQPPNLRMKGMIHRLHLVHTKAVNPENA